MVNDRRKCATSVGLVAAAWLLGAAALVGQSQIELPTEDGRAVSRHPEAATAISQLWSPYCPGMMLEVCSSAQGAALRDSIQKMAETGSSSEEIVEWMLGNHGESYRALPPAKGVSILAWFGPPVVGVLGFFAVIVVLRRMMARRRSAHPGGEPRILSDADQARLYEAMRRVDQEEEAPLF